MNLLFTCEFGRTIRGTGPTRGAGVVSCDFFFFMFLLPFSIGGGGGGGARNPVPHISAPLFITLGSQMLESRTTNVIIVHAGESHLPLLTPALILLYVIMNEYD